VLTPDDAAAVLRRAAELDTPSLEQHDVLDEQVVRDAAREVGLSDAAVEQAVSEWRAGALAPLPPLPPDRRLGLPGSVAVEARLALPPAQAAERLDAWLRGQWFELRRTRGNESEWAPRSGPLASARRAADLDRRIRLRGVGRLRACVAPAESGSRVRLVAHVEGVRWGLLTGLVATPAVVAFGVVGTAAAALGGDPMPEVLLALPAAGGAGGLGWFAASAALQGRRTRLEEDLERAMDQLAHGPERKGLPDRAAAWAMQRLPRQLR
jgi:hypothetical protein